MITQRQIDHFQTFGFVVLRQYLSAADLERINAEVTKAMTEAYADEPFDGTKRHWLPLTGPQTPYMQSLLEDPRFHDAAQQLSGVDELVVLTVDANRYVGDTGWHSDTGTEYPFIGVKFVAYLEPLTAETGALRVIPGSHRQPYLGQISEYVQKVGDQLAIADLPGVALETTPGDVVAFNYPIFHASLGGSNDRRMCTIEFLEYPRTDDQAERMRGLVTRFEDSVGDTWRRDGYPMFHPDWIANPTGNPIRQQIIDRMQRLGMFDPVTTSS